MTLDLHPTHTILLAMQLKTTIWTHSFVILFPGWFESNIQIYNTLNFLFVRIPDSYSYIPSELTVLGTGDS
jgi:hypothetical protein